MIDMLDDGVDAWEKDVLNRKEYAESFCTLINKSKTPIVININAKWGSGKTYFLKNIRKDLISNHPVVYFDAWSTDYVDDPLVPFLNAINQQLSHMFGNRIRVNKSLDKVVETSSRLFKCVLPSVIKGVAKKFIGEEGTDAIISLSKEDEDTFLDITGTLGKEALKAQKITEDVMKESISNLEDLVNEVSKLTILKLPIIILIDELDRCRPSFAIELLENIKHFFSVEGIVFIITTDTEQLVKSFGPIYGESFNGDLYIRRLFDREYKLPEPSKKNFTNKLVVENKLYENIDSTHPNFLPHIDRDAFISIFSTLSEVFNLKLRDQEQCFAKIIAFMDINEGQRIYILWLLYLIIFQHARKDQYDKFCIKTTTNNVFAETFKNRFSGWRSIPDDADYFNEISITLDAYKLTITDTYEAIARKLEQLNRQDLSNNRNFNIEFEALQFVRENYHDMVKYLDMIKLVSQIR